LPKGSIDREVDIMSANDQPVTISLRTYGHTSEFKNGNVPVKDTKLEFIEVVPQVHAFRRMVRDFEFDVCELAPTTFLIAKALAKAPYRAIPVFFERRFHHGGLVVRPDANISGPKDLEGKRVGVRSYSGTTGVWTRGILINEYGLDNSKVNWVVDDEEHVRELQLPTNVEKVPPKSLANMMAAGELQAGFLSRSDKAANDGHAGLGRAGAAPGTEDYRELLENPFELGVEWYGRTGIYPMHSLLVIRDDVAESRPELPQLLYDALKASKQVYLDRLADGTADEKIDNRYRKQQKVVGPDPLPYGLEANRKSLEALMGYAVQQGLIPHPIDIDPLFFKVEG
jgi:4,5-dihydroxyphthalate decarboxylase